jgi:hypothetical protein
MLTEEQKDKIMYLATMLSKNVKNFALQRTSLAQRLQTTLPNTYGAGKSMEGAIQTLQTLNDLRKCAPVAPQLASLPDIFAFNQE